MLQIHRLTKNRTIFSHAENRPKEAEVISKSPNRTTNSLRRSCAKRLLFTWKWQRASADSITFC